MSLYDLFETSVHMLPVCECGQIISDLYAEVPDIEPPNRFKYPSIFFYPPRCPNCGRYIKEIQIDEKYTDMFRYQKI